MADTDFPMDLWASSSRKIVALYLENGAHELMMSNDYRIQLILTYLLEVIDSLDIPQKKMVSVGFVPSYVFCC